MVQSAREEINQINIKVKDQELKTEQYIKSTQTQIHNIQKSISDTLHGHNVRRTEEMNKTIENAVAKEMDEKIGLRLDSIFTVRMAPTIDTAVKTRLDRLEKRIDEKIDNRVENLVNQKMQNEFDEFQDQLWRQKNILIVGLPESKKSDVEQRKRDDLQEAHRIFNLFVDTDSRDIECMPVRLGRIGTKPRTLLVTLRSEHLVKQITEKARAQNQLLNPTETDNKKKVYLNRDYTPRIIELRKNLYEEKKERESKGETNLIYRKRKVIQDPRVAKYQNQYQHRREGNDRRQGTDRYSQRGDYNRNRAQDTYRERSQSRDRYSNRSHDYRPRNKLDQNAHQVIDNQRDYQEYNYRQENNNYRQENNSQMSYPGQEQQEFNNYRQENNSQMRYPGQEQQQRMNRQYDHPNQDFDRFRNQGVNKPQDLNIEPGRSPLNRQIQRNDRDRQNELSQANRSEPGQYRQNSSNPSTLYRDEEGPYYRDDCGREIRGAEANLSSTRQNHSAEREERDYDERGRHYNQNKSGREIRKSSQNYNKNQPGSKPYAGTHWH